MRCPPTLLPWWPLVCGHRGQESRSTGTSCSVWAQWTAARKLYWWGDHLSSKTGLDAPHVEQPGTVRGEDKRKMLRTQRCGKRRKVLLILIIQICSTVSQGVLVHQDPHRRGFSLIYWVFLRQFMFLDTNEIGQLKGHCSAFKCFTHH